MYTEGKTLHVPVIVAVYCTDICQYVIGPRECDMRYANTLRAARIRYAVREIAMGRANAICDTPNTLWAARMRYAIREYAKGHANAICDTRISYAL